MVGDGKELFRSEQLESGEEVLIDLPITGIDRLELVTDSGMKSTHTCWAVWGSAKVSRGGKAESGDGPEE